MVTGRRAIAWSSAAVLFLSATLFAQAPAAPQPRKLTKTEKKEIETIQKLVDDSAAGQAMPNDLGLTWVREDVLKAQGNKQYIPFNVFIDPSKVADGKLSFYWRVVSKDAAPPAEGEEPKKGARPEYAYEDLNTVEIPSDAASPLRISRSFTVSAGNYDLFILAKEPLPEKSRKGAPPQKVSIIKHELTVPDLWNGEMNTSSVIVAERIDPLPVAPTPQQQTQRPYALGAMEIVPAMSTKFAKNDELSTFLLIYNVKTTDGTNMPDVTVEYNFYVKSDGTEKFFNKTNPQSLNAQTLPAGFDFAAGHQLQSGQAVPLASFPEGDYRLEIKVVDKLANTTLVRNVNFSVAGS